MDAQQRQYQKKVLKFHRVFGSPEGQSVLAEILSKADVFHAAAYKENDSDTRYKDGMRHLAIWIWEKSGGKVNLQKADAMKTQMQINASESTIKIG